MMRRLLVAAIVATSALAVAGRAQAAPPVLISVGHVERHPEATWSLPAGVKSQVAEVAISPATSTDGYFFFENVRAFSTLEDSQTHWLYTFQLDPGTYYIHVGGIDEPCYFAGLCPVREFSQIWTRIMPPWAGYVRGRYRRYVEFSWRASGRVAVRKRVLIYE
jgi:hypothetical protein